ncbi:MAG TPA: GNAT family N-acetyltransferase [Steroidobacteraceae bacterium]
MRIVSGAAVGAMRRFNRFYTGRIGVLQEHLLSSPFTLVQARVLYELAARRKLTAGQLVDALQLDPGYLSRILRDLHARRLLARRRPAADRRRTELTLTARGRSAFEALDRGSRAANAALLAPLSAAQRRRALVAMRALQEILTPAAGEPPPRPRVSLRTHRIGDIGWAIELHGRVYAKEYGWNAEFEALVATLFARFATRHDPRAERCWIANVDGERAGCVFVVRSDEAPTTAQLRCLLVDPRARGLGIGRRLIDESLRFARAAGYRRMLLWTNDVLTVARRLYEAAGFTLLEQSRHHRFGHDLLGQTWVREL